MYFFSNEKAASILLPLTVKTTAANRFLVLYNSGRRNKECLGKVEKDLFLITVRLVKLYSITPRIQTNSSLFQRPSFLQPKNMLWLNFQPRILTRSNTVTYISYQPTYYLGLDR
jgi:hypothetical protein